MRSSFTLSPFGFLDLKPDHTHAHFNWGNALAQQGKLAEAIAHYQQALQIRPDHADGFLAALPGFTTIAGTSFALTNFLAGLSWSCFWCSSCGDDRRKKCRGPTSFDRSDLE
jgi:tetratricopeptide (TPR) repeat protein